jgi:hypothetical protein
VPTIQGFLTINLSTPPGNFCPYWLEGEKISRPVRIVIGLVVTIMDFPLSSDFDFRFGSLVNIGSNFQ